MSKLSDFRKSYELGELDEAQAADGPLALFNRWMDEAIAHDVSEPTGHGRQQRPALHARRAAQGLRRARHGLVHQLRKPQR
jgi:pyridoxine/pyridoxamine 5'-phosphate oxidase